MRANMAGKMLSILSLEGGHYDGPVPLPDIPATLRFRLGPPEYTGMGVTDIFFVRQPERIIITGDCHPALGDGGGLISNPGYGLWWFARPQGENYLGEKFLRTAFYPQLAREWLQGWLTDALGGKRESTPKQVQEVTVVLGEHESLVLEDYKSFADFLRDVLSIDPEDEGIGYDPKVLGWLAAVQQRFALLFAAMTAGDVAMQRAAVEYAFWAIQPADGAGHLPSSALVRTSTQRFAATKCSEVFLRSLPPGAPGVADILATLPVAGAAA